MKHEKNMKVLSKIFSSKFIFQNVVQAGALVHGPHSFVDSTRVHAGEEVDHQNNHVQQHTYMTIFIFTLVMIS